MNRNDKKIGWCDWTLNIAVGCTVGCGYCFARRQAKRQRQRCKKCYEFVPHIHWERIEQLGPGQRPARVFLNSMADWGCQGIRRHVPEIIRKVQERAPQHTYIVLTKIPLAFSEIEFPANWGLGVSVVNQASADMGITQMWEQRAGMLLLVIEPMLGPVDLTRCKDGKCTADWLSGVWWDQGSDATGEPDGITGEMVLDGVIVGGQTGANAPPMHPDWVRKVRDDCVAAGVPFFFKGWGEWAHDPRGGRVLCGQKWLDRHEWPDGSSSNRIGKKDAGRVLDGRTWGEFPKGATP